MRGGPEATIMLWSPEGHERLIPRYRKEEFLGYGFRETPPPPQATEPVVAAKPTITPEPPRMAATLKKANNDLRTVRREEVEAIADYYNVPFDETITTRRILTAINEAREQGRI